jgi:septum formation protein
MNWLTDYNFILASRSPRRQELLRMLGISFTVSDSEVEETFPEGLLKSEIPVYLAKLKANPLLSALREKDLLITADTVVFLNGEIIGKPANHAEAEEILQKLSGKEHQVISGVCLSSVEKQVSFHSMSKVRFKKLRTEEIQFYIKTYKPFDKAGAYGIQEWIGLVGITRIEGSYTNIMGLPVQELYEAIIRF